MTCDCKRKPTWEQWTDDGVYRPELLSSEDRQYIEAGKVNRVCGDMVCLCGHLYYEHPKIPHSAYLNRLCDGRIVKL